MAIDFEKIKNVLDPALGINPESVLPMGFQGQMSQVFTAESSIYGHLVIKTAKTEDGVDQNACDEIKINLEGYDAIPKKYRPEVVAVNNEGSIMVMRYAGLPIRDLFWVNRDSPDICKTIVSEFQKNLVGLLSITSNGGAREECKAYLDSLLSIGNGFLTSNIFPNNLRRGFENITRLALGKNEKVGAFASIDATQGNLLIDSSRIPHTLKLIDPKLPRITNGNPNFTGIPEIDLGMFLTTVELNAPGVLKQLDLENILVSAALTLHKDSDKVKFYLDVGKVFGCILVASFPNTVERVTTYLNTFEVELSEAQTIDVEREREKHIDKALKIVNNY